MRGTRSFARDQARGRRTPVVAVVGAGVSGCACAAVLGCLGVRVLVLNSALDAVGLPGYGPELIPGERGWEEIEETFAALPKVLREPWLNASSVPVDGTPVVTVDRRTISIETKRALEGVAGLQFRQALVTGIRTAAGSEGPTRGATREGVAVETAFGEVIEADAVVVAVGLSLGGRLTVGANMMSGGRYGEMASEGLRKSLESMGARFRQASVEVGVRFSCGSIREAVVLAGLPKGQVVRETMTARTYLQGGAARNSGETCPQSRGLVESAGKNGPVIKGQEPCHVRKTVGDEWPEGYPPAAHWAGWLRREGVVLRDSPGGGSAPVLSPDGVATGEFYLGGEFASCVSGVMGGSGDVSGPEGVTVSRPGQSVRGLVVENLEAGGRLIVESGGKSWVWVAGRAAGAGGYLESLRSGVRVGRELAGALADWSTVGSGAGMYWPGTQGVDIGPWGGAEE